LKYFCRFITLQRTQLTRNMNTVSNEPLTDINQIVKSPYHLDAHCWIQFEDGTTCDYDDVDLSKTSSYGNLDIIRVPFPLDVQIKLLPFVKNIIDRFNGTVDGFSKEKMDIVFAQILNTTGYCFIRSYLAKPRYTNKGIKCKIVYGSLGFKQANNKYFYEFG